MSSIKIDYGLIATDPPKAMREATRILASARIDVVKVESDGKTKRAAGGVKFREARFLLADGQSTTLRVKETGDVAQVLINDKLIPIAAQADASEAVKEIAAKLNAGRAQFQKKLAAVKVAIPAGTRSAIPSTRAKLQGQIAEVDQQIEAAREELANLQTAQPA